MKVAFKDTGEKMGTAVALFVKQTALDKTFKGLESRCAPLHFDGKPGQVQCVDAVCGFEKVYMVGVTIKEGVEDLRNAGAYIVKAARRDSAVQVCVDALDKATIAQLAYGAYLASYTFDKYKTVDNKKRHLHNILFVGKNATDASKCFANLQAVASGVFLARDLVNEPANILTPDTFAKTVLSLTDLGISVKLLEKDALKDFGMGALLGVAQGSKNPPYVAIMEYRGQQDSVSPYVFVGKGLTFDSGGISLKPAGGMEDMKSDMGGAAAVVGTLKAVAKRKARANVVGIIGLTENMPGGNAQRPGDIVTSMSGQTIEVINTDAEGRLVLADCLTYAQRHYKAKVIIDVATLTGAVIVALGSEYAGVFSNDDTLAKALIKAGKCEGENLWHLPLSKNYDKMLDSPIADMKNVGDRWAGACTAAQFLGRFIEKGTAWAHIDIAGTALANKGKPTCVKGATGYGVKLLDRLVLDGEQ